MRNINLSISSCVRRKKLRNSGKIFSINLRNILNAHIESILSLHSELVKYEPPSILLKNPKFLNEIQIQGLLFGFQKKFSILFISL